MENKLLSFTSIVMLLILGGCDLMSSEPVYYENPIGEMTDIGDPYVLKVDDRYYMYATSAPDFGYIVWESDNLVDWEEVGLAYNHFDQEEYWGTRDFWAPEVVERDGTFYMTLSARTEEDSFKIFSLFHYVQQQE